MIKKTSRSKVYYIDTFAQKSSHEMFNTSLIVMCSLIFNSVKCNISKSSFLSLENILNAKIPLNVNFNTILVVKGESKFSLILRYIISSLQNIRYLIASPKDSVVIFPFNNLLSLQIVNLLNKILKRKIIIFCHGEMEGLINNANGKGYLHSILIKLVKGFFFNPKVKVSERIYFSVLGDNLKKNLTNVISADKISRFISIDHPYIFQDVNHTQDFESDLLSIGTVGTLTKLKGIDTFIAFINELDPNMRESVDISIIGQISGDVSLFQRHNINIVPNNKILSRLDYNLSIKKLNLIMFFYPTNSYKITASAAVYDAILHEKPIIALKNDYFAYLFKKFGDFGYLCKDTHEMINKLYELIDDTNQINFDFVTLKDKLTPEKISSQLADELSRIEYLS